MHSLMAFLQVEPLSNKPAFDRAITKRIKARDERGLATLRNAMAHLALRRSKQQVHSTIQLVEKTVEERVVPFPDGKHKELHDVLFLTARATFLGFLKNKDFEGIVDNYMAFLELILRVRQSCCHGGLVPEERRENAMQVYDMVKKADLSTLDPDIAQQLLDKLRGIIGEEAEGSECAVCLEVLEEENVMILKTCQHVFCEPCLNRITNHVCPCCRAPVSIRKFNIECREILFSHVPLSLLLTVSISRITSSFLSLQYGPEDMVSKAAAEASAKSARFQDDKEKEKEVKHATRNVKDAMKLGRSPKIQALLDAIDQMAPDEKGVIFSQWT